MIPIEMRNLLVRYTLNLLGTVKNIIVYDEKAINNLSFNSKYIDQKIFSNNGGN